VPSTKSAPASGSTATTVAPSTSSPKTTNTQSKLKTKTRIVLSSRTISSTGGGWNTPDWLIAVLGVLVALGIAGLAWSEVARRRQGEST
jgi:hypothetical protein